jgi:hypothetical protein
MNPNDCATGAKSFNLIALLIIAMAWAGNAADFSVTSPGSFYSINGLQPNPFITLMRGQTYTFEINADPSHPFEILTDQGVDNNNISQGTLTFTVPSTAPDTLAYICSIHGFGGLIYIIGSVSTADFNVTTPDAYYLINGNGPNPTITLTRGSNYTFAIHAEADHPFQISSDANGTPYDSGVANNNISEGTLTFTVPSDAPDTLYYVCSIHIFGGTISIVNPPDFTVTTPGFYYSINGQDSNPTITLTRGVTYTFAIDAESDHPFQISSDADGSSYDNGVVNNNINEGTLIFTVPADAPDTLYYVCTVHIFGGTINIVNPPPPPAPYVKVISVALTSSNVTLQSTGTNGWTAIPEFTSNLTTRFWLTVPSFSNTYTNGTNITKFNRLEAICGPNVFLRVRNTNN